MQYAPLIAVSVLCVGLFVAGLVFFTVRMTAPVVYTAQTFMQAIQDKNYPAAFEMLAEPLQIRMGSSKALGETFTEQRVFPDTWWFSSRRVNSRNGRVKGGYLRADGSKHKIVLVLEPCEYTWVISSFSFA